MLNLPGQPAGVRLPDSERVWIRHLGETINPTTDVAKLGHRLLVHDGLPLVTQVLRQLPRMPLR
jgi:hypothetical protein